MLFVVSVGKDLEVKVISYGSHNCYCCILGLLSSEVTIGSGKHFPAAHFTTITMRTMTIELTGLGPKDN